MKLGFVVVSNNPVKLKRFIASTQHLDRLKQHALFTLTHQRPVTKDDIQPFDRTVELEPFDHSKPLPLLQLRRHGLQLVSDCDYICYLDDDHQFVPERPGKTYPKSSDDYYMEAIEWMDENPDVGVLSLRGYFGGYAWGYNFKKMPANGLIENNAGGIFMRNIGIDRIFPRECWDFIGVMSESLSGFNVMSHGYKLAKRFNCPNKFDVPGANKHVGVNANISYSEEICNANAQGYIRRKFNDPTWRHSSKQYPKGILEILSAKKENV